MSIFGEKNINDAISIDEKKKSGFKRFKFQLNMPVKMRILQKLKDEESPYFKLLKHDLHNILDPRSGENKKYQMVYCPKTEGGNCPICDKYWELYNLGKTSGMELLQNAVKPWNQREETWVRAVIRGQNELVPELIKLPASVTKEIKRFANEGRNHEEMKIIENTFLAKLEQYKKTATPEQVQAMTAKMKQEMDRLKLERIELIDISRNGYDIIVTQILKDPNKGNHYSNITYKVQLASNKPRLLYEAIDPNNPKLKIADREAEQRLYQNMNYYDSLYKYSIFNESELSQLVDQLIVPIQSLIEQASPQGI